MPPNYDSVAPYVAIMTPLHTLGCNSRRIYVVSCIVSHLLSVCLRVSLRVRLFVCVYAACVELYGRACSIIIRTQRRR